MKANQSKSHTEKEIIIAVFQGKKIAFLDSGSSGNDDLLIIEPGETLETAQADVENWYECNYPNSRSPFEQGSDSWALRLVDKDEWE
jgi:hypothetical protein